MASELFGAVEALFPAPGADEGTPGANAMRSEAGCRVAQGILKEERSTQRVLQALMVAVAAAGALVTIVLLFQLLDLNTTADALKSAAAAGGVIISGGMTTFLLARVSDANKRVDKWAKLVNDRCPTR